MRWANFLSMFHFQIVHVDGKKNVVADALSRKPQMSAVSIVYHDALDEMEDQYTQMRSFEEFLISWRMEIVMSTTRSRIVIF